MASTLLGQSNQVDILGTAEELLESFEQAAYLLDDIEDKYMHNINDDGHQSKKNTFQQFREGLDTARTLFGTLKREKWRMSKRELSVELRMGELEDYKSHLKSDMSSLNETVDILSVRIIQLENDLVECQDTRERLEADVNYYKEQVDNGQKAIKSLTKLNEKLKGELKSLRSPENLDLLEKKLTSLEIANNILQEENGNLKSFIREQDDNIMKELVNKVPAKSTDKNVTKEVSKEAVSM